MITKLHDLFVLEIQDLYDAEKQITQALPQVMEAVSHPELLKGMEEHLMETEKQIKRLETLCHELGIEPQGKTCLGMEGIIEESAELLQENESSPTLDAAIIAGAQKIEHYEIAGYGTAAAYAKQLGYDNALNLLVTTLEEEKAEDEKLTNMAEVIINKQAESHGEYAL